MTDREFNDKIIRDIQTEYRLSQKEAEKIFSFAFEEKHPYSKDEVKDYADHLAYWYSEMIKIREGWVQSIYDLVNNPN